jgi:hypothetical protein
MRQSGRIEIANNPGTLNQDAFAGRKYSLEGSEHIRLELTLIVMKNWIL